MAKMDGLELLRYLRGLKPRMPVVMLTAYGTVKRAVEAIKLGAVDFIEKPFDPKAIQLLCQEILERQKIGMSGTVDDLLHLAELARERKAFTEARVYLKIAMMRDLTRPEPYYQLAELSETCDIYAKRCTITIWLLRGPTFAPAREALKRLGHLDTKPTA